MWLTRNIRIQEWSGWGIYRVIGKKQIRHVFIIFNGSTPKSSVPEYWDGDIVWLTPDDLGDNPTKIISTSRRKITEDGYAACGTSIAKTGSIALSTCAPIGHIALTATDSCVNQGCRLLQPLEGNESFWYYVGVAAKPILVSLGQGSTFMELPTQKLASLKIPLPPIEEQQTIVHFLDYKTAQIDALIAKKEALLKKLAEKRTALISHAVTKGLDPSAPMKDSDVPWLGEIPAHWDVKRQRFMMAMSGGMTPSMSVSEFWEGEIPWVTPKDMKSERIAGSIDKVTEKALKETSIRLYADGRVLIVVRGMILAHSFPVAINDVPVTVNQDIKVIDTTLDPEYLAILLRGILSLVLSITEESAHGTKVLRTDFFKNIRLPIPPREEQGYIVKEVHRITDMSDRMAKTVFTAINRLKEYRTALITQAVTGKIDVRNVPIPA